MALRIVFRYNSEITYNKSFLALFVSCRLIKFFNFNFPYFGPFSEKLIKRTQALFRRITVYMYYIRCYSVNVNMGCFRLNGMLSITSDALDYFGCSRLLRMLSIISDALDYFGCFRVYTEKKCASAGMYMDVKFVHGTACIS